MKKGVGSSNSNTGIYFIIGIILIVGLILGGLFIGGVFKIDTSPNDGNGPDDPSLADNINDSLDTTLTDNETVEIPRRRGGGGSSSGGSGGGPVIIPGPTCIDSDSGLNYYESGSLLKEGEILYSKIIDSYKVYVYNDTYAYIREFDLNVSQGQEYTTELGTFIVTEINFNGPNVIPPMPDSDPEGGSSSGGGGSSSEIISSTNVIQMNNLTIAYIVMNDYCLNSFTLIERDCNIMESDKAIIKECNNGCYQGACYPECGDGICKESIEDTLNEGDILTITYEGIPYNISLFVTTINEVKFNINKINTSEIIIDETSEIMKWDHYYYENGSFEIYVTNITYDAIFGSNSSASFIIGENNVTCGSDCLDVTCNDFNFDKGTLDVCYDNVSRYDYSSCFNTSNFCSESDGGEDYYNKGTGFVGSSSVSGTSCSGGASGGGGGSDLTDSCIGIGGPGIIDPQILSEYYCNEDNKSVRIDYNCSDEGLICKDGACINKSLNSCEDSDGLNIYNKGKVSSYEQGILYESEDECILIPYSNFTILEEHTCSGTLQLNCINGCNDGACNGLQNPIPPCSDSDNGKDYLHKGTITGPIYNGDEEGLINAYTYEDYCGIKGQSEYLFEYFCSESGLVVSEGITCSNTQKCHEGACVTIGYNGWVVDDWNDKLELFESIADVETRVDDDYLDILGSGTITNEKGIAEYDQELVFMNQDSEFVKYAENVDEEIGLFLYIGDDSPIARYGLDFTSPNLKSDIEPDGDLQDIVDKEISMLGEIYTITRANYNNYSGVKLDLMSGVDKTTLSNEEQVVIDGRTVSVLVSSATEAKFTVDGEDSSKLSIGETYKFQNGAYVGVTDITYQDFAEGLAQATFYLGTEKIELQDGNEVIFNGNGIDGTLVNIYSWAPDLEITITEISVQMNNTNGDGIYVPAGGKLSDHLDESELLFGGNWDIEYHGLAQNSYEKISLKPSLTNEEYVLKFNLLDVSYNVDLPLFFSNEHGIFGGERSGKELIFTPEQSISRYEYFILASESPYNPDNNPHSCVVQYRSADWDYDSEEELTFRVLGDEGEVYELFDSEGNQTAQVTLCGQDYYFTNVSPINSDNFDIKLISSNNAMARNNGGAIKAGIRTRNNALIEIINQNPTNDSSYWYVSLKIDDPDRDGDDLDMSIFPETVFMASFKENYGEIDVDFGSTDDLWLEDPEVSFNISNYIEKYITRYGVEINNEIINSGNPHLRLFVPEEIVNPIVIVSSKNVESYQGDYTCIEYLDTQYTQPDNWNLNPGEMSYESGKVIVKFDDEAFPSESFEESYLNALNFSIDTNWGNSVYMINVPNGSEFEWVCAFQEMSIVEFAELNVIGTGIGSGGGSSSGALPTGGIWQGIINFFKNLFS
jgi:hypothetical protein